MTPNTNLLELTIEAALLGAKQIMDIYCNPNSDFEIERKSDNSPLTIADKRANGAICEHLKNSGIPIISEEIANLPYTERANFKQVWIIDPLDGTKEFIKRTDDFTVNIALASDGVPIMGVVYLPVEKTLYYAQDTLGSFKVTDVDISDFLNLGYTKMAEKATKLPLKTASNRPYIVVASISHLTPETATFIDSLKQEHPNLEIVSRGSSIKICLVAEGSADIYPRFGPTMEWDTAAGHAIALWAGKQLYNATSSTPLSALTYNKENLLNPQFIVR